MPWSSLPPSRCPLYRICLPVYGILAHHTPGRLRASILLASGFRRRPRMTALLGPGSSQLLEYGWSVAGHVADCEPVGR